MNDNQQLNNKETLLNRINQQQRLGEHLSANQEERLISSIAIAIQRARERRAPQQVIIQITDKGYPRFIDPTDNHGPVE
jgi:hypothetical protein